MKHASSMDKGASLISVLVIVMMMSLAALAATDGLARTVDSARTSGYRSDTFWTARGAAFAAEAYLTEAIGKTGRQLTLDSEIWAQDIVFPTKRGVVSARIRERTNCFNLDGLLEDSDEFALREDRFEAFQALLTASGINETEAAILVRNLTDWMRPDPSIGRKPANAGELLAIEGITPEVFSKIRPLVCVLGDKEQPALNLNTMEAWQAPLLTSLFSTELSGAEARYLLERRPNAGWPDINQILLLDSVQRISPDARNDAAISLSSTHFEVDLAVQGGSGLAEYSVLFGPDGDTGSQFRSMERMEF